MKKDRSILDDQYIAKTTEFKYLGLVLDFYFGPQINRNYWTTSCHIVFDCFGSSLILSHLEYSTIFLEQTIEISIMSLEKQLSWALKRTFL